MATLGSEVEKKKKLKRKRNIFADLEVKTKTVSLSDFLIPLAVLILMVTTALIIFPYFNEIFELNNEIGVLEGENQILVNKLNCLEEISVIEQNNVFERLDAVLPTNIRVSTLSIYVKGIASKYDLIQRGLKLDENIGSAILTVYDVRGFQDVKLPDTLNVVTGPFTYVGSIENISGFMDELTTSGTLVSVNDLTIRKYHVVQPEEGVVDELYDLSLYDGMDIDNLWTVNFTIVGYSLTRPSTYLITTPLKVYDYESILGALDELDASNEE